MFSRATLFRRELGFDFIQWQLPKVDDPKNIGFLFNDTTETFGHGAIVGACAFYQHGKNWVLQWVWINPSVRGKGLLSERWDYFISKFGDFLVEGPISEDMEKFLLKKATKKQKKIMKIQN